MVRRWTPEEFAKAIGGRLVDEGEDHSLTDAYYSERGETLSPKDIRTIRGDLSVAEAGRIAGVTPAAWHHWESGQRTPRPESAARILRVRDQLPIEQRISRLEMVVYELVNEVKDLKGA